MTKIAGSESESGSISQRHGSADPDPHQNVMDPQHCPEQKGDERDASLRNVPKRLTNYKGDFN
jgi:hypothetical protein